MLSVLNRQRLFLGWFMFPFIEIFGRQIPVYAIMAILGAAALCGVSVVFAKLRGKVPAEDIFYMLLYAGIGCLIGSKLLYLIVSVDVYWLDGKSLKENFRYWLVLLTSGGLVFYGGLIGAALGALRYCTHFKVPAGDAFETVIPAVPLFHFFGRLGCFAAGCCYGKKYDGILSVTFKNAIGAPNGVPLLPVQLFEAAGNLLLFAVLTVLYLKAFPKLSLTGLYLVCYAAMRFTLEFFRGDDIRGNALSLSVSQWISIAAFAFGTVLIVKKCKNREMLSRGNS